MSYHFNNNMILIFSWCILDESLTATLFAGKKGVYWDWKVSIIFENMCKMIGKKL